MIKPSARLRSVVSAFLAVAVLPLLAACNINAERDYLDELMEWTGYWYTQGPDSQDAYARSKRLAEMYLEKKRDDVMAQTILGYCLLKLGPWDSDNVHEQTARSVFEKILTRYPENYRATMGLGLVHYKLSKVQVRDQLDGFSRALDGVRLLRQLAVDLHAAEAREHASAAANELNARLGAVFADFSSDMKKFTARDIFPVRLYESLVADQDRRGDTRPDQYLVKQAVQARVTQLLDAMQLALRQLPLDSAGFIANIDRIGLLMKVGHDYYRQDYIDRLDKSLELFHLCEQFHHRDRVEYFWVYEYLALTYYLKLSTLPAPAGQERRAPGGVPLPDEGDRVSMVQADAAGSTPEVEAERLRLLQLVAHYTELFIDKDIAFETKRLNRAGDERIEKMAAENPYWANPVEDFQSLMQELVDDARIHRVRVIEMLLDLEIRRLDRLSDAEKMCDKLAEAEVRFTDDRPMSEQPVLHWFYRAEVFRQRAVEMERGWKLNADGVPVPPTRQVESADGNGKDLTEMHKSWWSDAYRHYSRFVARSPVAAMKSVRELARVRQDECLKRYPEFATYPTDNW